MKPQLHSSAIRTYFNCGEQFRRAYVLGEKRPPGVARVVGSATHESIEPNMKAKRDTGSLLPIEHISDLARDAVVSRWDAEGVDLNDEEREKGEKEVKAEAVDMAVALSRLHYKALAPAISPLHVERPWVLDLGGFPYDLAGRIDLQETNGTVRDTKTAARKPIAGDADKREQLTVYALAVKTLDGFIPSLTIDYLVKAKTPVTDKQTTTRTNDDFRVFLNRLEIMCEGLEKEIFIPTNPEVNYLCSPRFCGYALTCKYYRRMR